MENTFLNKLTRIKAIAGTGLLYAADEYNKERYTELRETCFGMPHMLMRSFNKKMHAYSPGLSYTCKMAFYCKAISAIVQKGFDVPDVQYFDIN